jgi:hypothetical protein
MDADRFATRVLSRPDPQGGPGPGTVNATLRAEALRQLRWQQREWTRILATKDPGLIAVAARAGFTDGLDLLREAGEDVPSWLSRRGSPVRITDGTSGATARVGLTKLLADLTQALAWFDPEPSAPDQAGSAERPQPGAAGDRGPCVGGSPAPTPEHAAPGFRITSGAGTPECTSGGGVPQGVGQGGGRLTGKPTDEGHDAAAGEWTVGDRVRARANAITVPAGRRGTIRGFSSGGGHPLVDFHGSGLVLVRADRLDRDDNAPAEASSPGRPRSSGTTRLSATPRPPTVAAMPPPPPSDWCDRPIATTSPQDEPTGEGVMPQQRPPPTRGSPQRRRQSDCSQA